MKSTAEKSSATPSKVQPSKPFLNKTGTGGIFAKKDDTSKPFFHAVSPKKQEAPKASIEKTTPIESADIQRTSSPLRVAHLNLPSDMEARQSKQDAVPEIQAQQAIAPDKFAAPSASPTPVIEKQPTPVNKPNLEAQVHPVPPSLAPAIISKAAEQEPVAIKQEQPLTESLQQLQAKQVAETVKGQEAVTPKPPIESKPQMPAESPTTSSAGAPQKTADKSGEEAKPNAKGTAPQLQKPAAKPPSKKGGQPPQPGATAVAPPKPELDSSDSPSLLNALASSTPSGFIQGVKQSGALVSNIQQKEKDQLASDLPEIEQPTGIPVKGEQPAKKANPGLPKGKAPDLKVKEGSGGKHVEPKHLQTTAKANIANIPTPKAHGDNDPAFANNIKQAINQIPTQDGAVNTSAGERPKVDLAGEADPAQNEGNQAISDGKVNLEQTKADNAVLQDFGENDIYPEIKREIMRPNVQLAPIPAAPNTESLGDLPAASAEIYTAFDEQAKVTMDAQVQVEMDKHEVERQKLEEDSAREREDGQRKIDEETDKVKTQQEEAQGAAKSEVEGHRKDWNAENEQVKNEYSNKSQSKKNEIDTEIDTKVKETDTKVDTELSNAENQAEQERLKTEEEAERKKREAENQEPGFWDSVTSAISDFFDALKEGLNMLFDGLRKLVKGIIEAAKKAVNALIDLARNAIVGLIKAFGEALKAFVNFALAAFPEIAKKINGLIDKAVDVAVKVVNKLADGLKKLAAAILDAIGAVLDAILSAYQAVMNAILDVLEFIAVGIIKIIQGIANLGVGFAAMLDKMHGALLEEFLGTDISEPLPNVERTDAEIAAHSTGSLPAESSLNDPGEHAQMQALATKSEFADEDVQLAEPAPVELDPALMASLPPIPENGLIELGGADDQAVTTKDMQSLLTGDDGAGTGAPIQQQTEEQGAVPGPAPDEDFANMSDDQKLDYHIKQMEESMGQPSAEDAKDPTPATNDPEVPYEVKTNRLSIGKRLEFVGRQMMKGMEIWWDQNQVAIYAAMIGILIVGGIIAIFTGGAGLIALVEILLQVMMAYFIADALMRIKGYLGDFFSQSWDGNTEAGGKSLAKAIAVLISEFLFEFILKGVGKVLKKIKSLIKATKTGAKAFKVINKVQRAVTKGVKAVKNVAVKGGKFVIGGIRKGLGKGAKTLGELKERLLKAFGFKRIWMEKHGKKFQLWGEFNSKVLLSTGEIVEVDEGNITHLGQKGKFKALSGKRVEGEVIEVGKDVGRETRLIKNRRTGSTDVKINEAQYNLPKGKSSLDIPTKDELGDFLEKEATKINSSWDVSKLSDAERDAINEASEIWQKRLLEAQARGRHVEKKLRFMDDISELPWQRQGVDIKFDDLSYEVLSGTNYNVSKHAKRMADELYRLIIFNKK